MLVGIVVLGAMIVAGLCTRMFYQIVVGSGTLQLEGNGWKRNASVGGYSSSRSLDALLTILTPEQTVHHPCTISKTASHQETNTEPVSCLQ